MSMGRPTGLTHAWAAPWRTGVITVTAWSRARSDSANSRIWVWTPPGSSHAYGQISATRIGGRLLRPPGLEHVPVRRRRRDQPLVLRREGLGERDDVLAAVPARFHPQGRAEHEPPSF